MMSIASVCKGKKKNQSPFSRTRKSCRSASCLLGVSFPTLKKKKKKIERKRKKKKEKKGRGRKRKEKKREKEKKKKKTPRTAQLPLRPSQSDMVFGACPVLSFTSPPSSQWVGPGEPLREQRMQSRRLQSFLQEKKKKAASTPAASKVAIPSAGYLE